MKGIDSSSAGAFDLQAAVMDAVNVLAVCAVALDEANEKAGRVAAGCGTDVPGEAVEAIAVYYGTARVLRKLHSELSRAWETV